MSCLSNQATKQPSNQGSSLTPKASSFCSNPLLWLVAFVFWYSCSQPDPLAPDLPVLPRSFTLTNLPSSIDDRLYFDDFDHFRSYFLELDSLLTIDEDLFDSLVLEESPVTTVNDLLSTDSYSNPDSAYRTFLTDPVMRAVVNPYYEFQIGQVLVTYINNSEILTSDASNSSIRSTLRTIPKGVPLDINSIPDGAFWSDDRDIEEAIAIFCNCRITIRPYDCENLRVFGRCSNLFGGKGGGTVTITYQTDPGIGEPIAVLTENVNGNFEFFVSIIFRQTGIIYATVDPDCVLGGNQYTSFYYDANSYASCDEKEQSSIEIITDGNERMEIETSFFENLFAYYHKAEIISWTWTGSKWERRKAKLRVQVDANRKSIVCAFLGSKSDTENCNNCRRRITRVSWTNPVAHCDGDLVGTYRKIKSGITINHTQSVDFDCCD